MSLSLRNFSLFLIMALIGALITATGCISSPKDSSADLRSATASVDLIYYTEQLPPYNYQENGTLQGISIDLPEGITEKMGRKVSRDEVLLVPWTGGYQTVLSHNNIVLFTTVRLPEREQSFKSLLEKNGGSDREYTYQISSLQTPASRMSYRR